MTQLLGRMSAMRISAIVGGSAVIAMAALALANSGSAPDAPVIINTVAEGSGTTTPTTTTPTTTTPLPTAAYSQSATAPVKATFFGKS